MYPPNRNPTEMYYERHALLRQEARNKRLARRPLAALSTLLVVILAFTGLVSIVVGPGVAIDYVGTYLLPGAWMIGVLAAVVGLLMLGGGKTPEDGTKPSDRLYWHIW